MRTHGCVHLQWIELIVWPVISTERQSVSEAASVALARRPVSPANPPKQPAPPARQHGGGGQEAPHLPTGLAGAAAASPPHPPPGRVIRRRGDLACPAVFP